MWETFKLIASLLGIGAVVYLLVKKHETRLVLMLVGVSLCVLSLKPMDAFKAFAATMTTAGLIAAICSSMGFAYVMKHTKCDMHLVTLLTRPMRTLGLIAVPMTALMTFFINIAIPSAAGCAAAVGATMIPILIRSGVNPAMAGAAVFMGTFGSIASPGSAHNAFVANASGLTITEVIQSHFAYTLTTGVIGAISLFFVALVLKDFKRGGAAAPAAVADPAPDNAPAPAEQIEKVNLLFALAPLVPLVLLIAGATPLSDMEGWGWLNMAVPEAMVIGAIYAILVTRANPSKITDDFFNGMGYAYAMVMGIIIAASVFVAGLNATGAVDYAVEFLRDATHFVRIGGSAGPFIMAIIVGSGDAAAMAFNGAVLPHAEALGYSKVNLGMGAALAGALGRTMSPIAGAAIVCAGLAQVSPIKIAKRTAAGMIISLFFVMFVML